MHEQGARKVQGQQLVQPRVQNTRQPLKTWQGKDKSRKAKTRHYTCMELFGDNHQAGAHSQSKAGGPLKTNPVLACLGKGTRLWAHDEGVWLGGTQVRLVRDY